jgi:hypothetical protein
MMPPRSPVRALQAVAVIALTTISGTTGAAEDKLCSELIAFREAPMQAHQTRERDWVELRWVGTWMDVAVGWHFECRNSGAPAARELCDYLKANTSFEFSDYLPVRFLECSGFTVPSPYPTLYPWIGSVDLGWRATNSHGAERLPLLEIALGHHKSLPDSIRISVFKGDANELNSPLPELFPSSDFATEH